MATEVTAGQFRTWALAQGYEPPEQPSWTAPDVPVVNATWADGGARGRSPGDHVSPGARQPASGPRSRSRAGGTEHHPAPALGGILRHDRGVPFALGRRAGAGAGATCLSSASTELSGCQALLSLPG